MSSSTSAYTELEYAQEKFAAAQRAVVVASERKVIYDAATKAWRCAVSALWELGVPMPPAKLGNLEYPVNQAGYKICDAVEITKFARAYAAFELRVAWSKSLAAVGSVEAATKVDLTPPLVPAGLWTHQVGLVIVARDYSELVHVEGFPDSKSGPVEWPQVSP